MAESRTPQYSSYPQYEVQYVARRDRFTRFEQISHIGGIRPDGTRWQVSYDDAVRAIVEQNSRFFVRRHEGAAVELRVAANRRGQARLRAEADDGWGDRLDALPERLPMYGGAQVL